MVTIRRKRESDEYKHGQFPEKVITTWSRRKKESDKYKPGHYLFLCLLGLLPS